MAGSTKLMTASGGGVILTPATNTASDVTVQVPAANCTLGIQGPAFSAYLSASQSISSSTLTKIAFNTESFDTANCFDSSTNYRFTPNVAGYYQFNLVITPNGTSVTGADIRIYKNGSQYKRPQTSSGAATGGSALVYCNGTTDYVEFYGLVSATSPQFYSDGTTLYSYVDGALVRAA